VMDGHFVPNLTFGAPVVKAIRKATKKPFDVHLMISPVDPLIEDFVDAGADILTVHVEAGPHLHRTLQAIKSHGVRCGVSLNPHTPVEAITHVMDMVDLILIMTVNPGFGGQSFIPLLDKIVGARAMIERSGRKIDLQVDGGITPETAPKVIAAGADVLVAGTAVFKDGPEGYAKNIQALRS
ncbi:MAG: ribulose-phosphate 3-epimerase, partial [Alphaproteobacteria bacterium]|nr:ribulose-phosphate 3-epimerase [Alphaproteobacteria bacterium]